MKKIEAISHWEPAFIAFTGIPDVLFCFIFFCLRLYCVSLVGDEFWLPTVAVAPSQGMPPTKSPLSLLPVAIDQILYDHAPPIRFPAI